MTEVWFEKKKTSQEVNYKIPLEFFFYFKYSRKAFDILIHLHLQFPFPISSQCIFKTRRNKVSSEQIPKGERLVMDFQRCLLLLASLLMQV